jgi:hypothetical protein
VTSPVDEMKMAVVALALEVPAEVHEDVRTKWNAVVDYIRELRSAVADMWYEVRTEELDYLTDSTKTVARKVCEELDGQ